MVHRCADRNAQRPARVCLPGKLHVGEELGEAFSNELSVGLALRLLLWDLLIAEAVLAVCRAEQGWSAAVQAAIHNRFARAEPRWILKGLSHLGEDLLALGAALAVR